MQRASPALLSRLLALAAAAGLLQGCDTWAKLSRIGDQPALTSIQDPQKQPGYRPVSLPMPTPIAVEHRPNSLWQSGTRAFFKDQRATQVGDILTVVIDLNEQAKLENETTRTRTGSEAMGASNLFGFEGQIQKILPHDTNMSSLLNTNSTSSSDGHGKITRTDQVNVNIAMLVTQVLPNGNLVVVGHQEMRVNYDIRDLQITGVIRPLDISSTNTVTLDKIAEARVSYSGRGQLMDAQQQRYGEQFLDIVSPF
ncbi:MAG: flagellar basal body L-ring protein FlgH [Alphaproteobacteria bacterium]|nr:flagellar basal body L-ring protein FlgH [Alphaproteobacteria bacterium]